MGSISKIICKDCNRNETIHTGVGFKGYNLVCKECGKLSYFEYTNHPNKEDSPIWFEIPTFIRNKESVTGYKGPTVIQNANTFLIEFDQNNELGIKAFIQENEPILRAYGSLQRKQ